MKEVSPKECELCFTDAEAICLLYHTTTEENIHGLLFKDDKRLSDSSNYPKDHKYFSMMTMLHFVNLLICFLYFTLECNKIT